MSRVTNIKRAHWAALAIEAFREQVGRDDDATTVNDLICDLGHYCRMNGLDFIAICAHAISTWCAETDDPEDRRLDAGPDVSIVIPGNKRQMRAWRQKSTTASSRSTKRVPSDTL